MNYPKHVTILVPEGQHNLISILGTYMLFNKANQHRQQGGQGALFQVQLAACSDHVIFHEGFFSVHPHVQLSQISRTDLVIIPAIQQDFAVSIQQNSELVKWTREQYKAGAAVASICTGAFLLAATGLLNGHRCSTHWMAVNAFRKMFPKVEVTPDKIITEEDGIYTNGGALSFFNLILYLIEKYYDRETAVYCAKFMQIDMERSCQSPYMIFAGQKDHQDEVVRQAQEFIEAHVYDKICVEDLATRLCVGRRNFDRRFKMATGNTPLEYLQRVKVEAAKKFLETSRKTIQEVMYEVGYCDLKTFRHVFKKIAGLSPADYRNKYNKEQLLFSDAMAVSG